MRRASLKGPGTPAPGDSRGLAAPDDASGIPPEEARAIAERAHRGRVEPSGRPYIEHVRRIADSVPAESEAVAWLHNVLEWTGLTENAPALTGLARLERRALGPLTRRVGDDDRRFLIHVRTIARAPGTAGDIAPPSNPPT